MFDVAFEVLPWAWDADGRVLTCNYRSPLGAFREQITFPPGSEPDERTEGVFDLLSVACATSYYKAAPSREIRVRHALPAEAARELLTALFDHGLREYAVGNGLPLPLPVSFSHEVAAALIEPQQPSPGAPADARLLVPMGGGRDSALIANTLRPLSPTLFSVRHNPYVVAQADQLELTYITADRRIDPGLFAANARGALNGHVPVTAINSLVALAAASLTGHTDVVMSNEVSADYPSAIVDGLPVLHQFSKSTAFERVLRDALAASGSCLRYYSALRPYGELQIAEAFVRTTDLLDSIMSCNRAFTHRNTAAGTWCARCAKCRFVFLTLAPFVERDRLVAMFGRDPLWDLEDLGETEVLTGTTARPMDCVGTPHEAREAVRLIADGEWRRAPLIVALVAAMAASPLPPVDVASSTFAPAAVAELVGAVMR